MLLHNFIMYETIGSKLIPLITGSSAAKDDLVKHKILHAPSRNVRAAQVCTGVVKEIPLMLLKKTVSEDLP